MCAYVAEVVFEYERDIYLDAQRAWEIPLIVCKIKKKKHKANVFCGHEDNGIERDHSISIATTLKRVTYP